MYDWLNDAIADETDHVVTANLRLARTLRVAHGQRRLEAGAAAWRSPAIHAWHDWLTVLLGAALPTEGLPARINSQQSRLLWERCLRADIDDPLINIGGLARQCRDTWSRLQEWRLPLATCQNAAMGQDQRIFARAAGRYEQQLADNAWIDDAMLPTMLTALVAAGQVSPPRRVTLAGFDRTTPQIEVLLTEMRSAGTSIDKIGLDSPGESELQRYENADAELRAAGAWARAALDENPAHSCAIVVNNLEQQADRCERLIREGLTPGWQYAGPRHGNALNVSYGRKLSEYPAIHVALLALRWLYSDLNGREVSVLLRSSFTGQINTDGRSRLELRLREWPDRQWSRNLLLRAVGGLDESIDTTDWLGRVARLDEMLEETPDKQRPALWAEFVDAALRTLNWPGEATLESDDFQLDNRWRDLLNEFARLELVSPLMTGPEAVARISSMAADTVFQPESASFVVSVLGPLEAAGMSFDRLWVAGLSAADWPPAGRPSALLSRDLQREHGMPDATPEDTAEYALRVLRRLQASATQCVLSYPATIGDAEQLPTALLADVVESDGDLDPGWHALDLLRADGLEPVTEHVPPVATNEAVAGGAGTIQKQISDPFSAFAYGRLGIRWLPAFTTGIPPNVRGSLIHDALCNLYKDKPSQADIRAWNDTSLQRRIASAVDNAFRRHERHADTVLRQLFALERRRTVSLLNAVVAVDRRRDSFSVDNVEIAIDASIGRLNLHLRCDRIDSLGNGDLLILDYKTGVAKKFLSSGKPNDRQLVVYACAVKQKVAGLGLYNVDSRDVHIDGAGPALSETDDWHSQLAEWKQEVRHAAGAIADGDVRLSVKQGIQGARPLNLLSRFSELSREL